MSLSPQLSPGKEHTMTAAKPIAITGMACRFPGAPDIAAYWEMILAGQSQVGPAPAARFDRSLYYSAERGNRHRSYTDLACVLDYSHINTAAPSLPSVVRACPEAAFTTLYLTADQALASSAGQRQSLPSRTGVYVGHTRKSGLAGQMVVATYLPQVLSYLDEVGHLSPADRQRISQELTTRFREHAPRRGADGRPDLSSLTAASLIAQGLGLDGPAMVFNSACASSLSALAQATRALQLGTIDAAIVGSASHFHHDTLVLFSHAQSLSPRGSNPFDDSADGIVVGEGYAAIVLRREEDAIAEGLERHAIIRGIGISSDGKGKSLWAPRAEGQQLAVARAYAHIPDDRGPDYIEAHATGTQLGDATELSAIASSLTGRTHCGPIAVGSVKSNIGHTLESAGLAGLVKAVIAVREGVIPPTTGVTKLNSKIPWHDLPFTVPTSPQAWPELPSTQARRAAINAFGIGGLNVHVVIDQALTSDSIANTASSKTTSTQSSPRPISHEPIAIVGIGMIAAGCGNVQEFWQRLEQDQPALSTVPAKRWNERLYIDTERVHPWHTPTTLGGYVTDFAYDWRRHRIPPKQVAHASPVQFMILAAVEQAMAQAFGADAEQRLAPLAERAGVIVGTMFGGDFANQLLMGLRFPEFERAIRDALAYMPAQEREQAIEQFHTALLQHMPALLDETGSFTSSSLASRLTKTFDLFGGAVAVDGGLCGGAASLACAVDLLRSGDNDLMVCVAAQEDMTPTRFEALALTGDLATNVSDPRIVPGEGCVALILRRLSDAERDQQQVFGVIGDIQATFKTPPMGPRYASTAQRIIGHTLGAASHVELISTLSPQRAAQPAATVESSDLSGLHYSVHISSTHQLNQSPAAHSTVSQIDSTPAMTASPHDRILHFDATQKRKVRLRNKAKGGQQSIPPTTSVPQPKVNGRSHEPLSVAPPQAQATESAPITTSLASSAPTDHRQGLSSQELRNFLVDFVVDQTGYPVDMVEMDADLEADLGLDSIKKAQLLGELNEHYALEGRTDVDLDSLNTLAAIETFLQSVSASSAPAISSTSQPSLTASNSLASPSLAPVTVVPASLPPAPLTPATTRGIDRNELELKVVAFVVDQTGYPPDMVELDADLEADLGIDSIKKAQLLGELAEEYGLRADEATSLDDLPTLRSILDFTMNQLGGTNPLGNTAPATTPPPVATSPVPSRASSVPHKTSSAVQPSPPSQSPVTQHVNDDVHVDPAQLRERMIDFVVEQTGYPPEMVDVDADLEADLGIDSIKKAQLLGELQETYRFPTRDDLTLDDFPDLASMERFVLEMCAPQGSVARGRT